MLSDDERAAYQRDWMRPPTDRTTTTVPLGNRRSHPMYAIHAGLSPATLDSLVVEPFGHLAFGHRVVTDGDGWNCWGEAPGTDVNDADTRHVLVHIDTLGEAIDLALEVAEFYGEHLVPSTDPTHPGTLITVSLAEEFSEQYLVINQTGAHLLAATLRD